MAVRPSYLPEAELDRGGRTAWGAILAGTAVALAVFALLTLLGVGIGFATVEPRAADAVGTTPTGATVYLFLSQLVALFAGGYVAGRLAGVLHRVGSVLHGVTVWAVTTILTLWLAVSAVAGIFGAVTSTLSTVTSGAASALGAAIPDDLSLPDLSAADVSLDQLPEGVQEALREQGITPGNLQEEARAALRDVVSPQEQQQITQEAQETAGAIVRSPGDAGQEIESLVDELFGAGGVLSEEDRAQAAETLQTRLGITEAEAAAYLDQVQARAEEVQQGAERAVQEAQAAATEAADRASTAASRAGFLAFFASLLGLVAAAGGAFVGRVDPYDLPR